MVCFPKILNVNSDQIETFYRILNGEFKTFVGPGHWFEQSRALMRIGFGWPSVDELKQGIKNISLTLDRLK